MKNAQDNSVSWKNSHQKLSLLLYFTAVVLLAPTICIVVTSLQDFAQVDLYALIFSSEDSLFCNTGIVSLGSTLIAMLFSVMAGFILFRSNITGRHFFGLFIVIAIVIPLHVQATAWISLLGHSGILTQHIQTIFPHFSLYSPWGCAWIMGVYYIPLGSLLCGFAFSMVDSGLEEQTRLYKSRWETFSSITFLQALPGLFLCSCVIFALSLGEMTVTDLLAITTFSEKIYLLFSIYYQPHLAICLSVVMILVVLAMFLIIFRLVKRHGIALENFVTSQIYHNKFSWVYLMAIFIIVAWCWIALPTLLWNVGNYQKWLDVYHSVKTEYWGSLWIASVSAVCISFSALVICFAICHQARGSKFMIAVLVWLVFVPASLNGIGIIRLFNFLGQIPVIGQVAFAFQDSRYILVFGMLLRFLPYSVAILYISMRGISQKFDDIATLEGLSTAKRFFRVVLPINKFALLLSCFLCFALALGEIGTSILIVAPGPSTLTIRVFTLLHYGVRADVSSCALLLIITILVVGSFLGLGYRLKNK